MSESDEMFGSFSTNLADIKGGDDVGSLTGEDIDRELTKISEATRDDRPPALYSHCLRVYKCMMDEVKIDDDGRAVWEGFLTRLVNGQLGLSVPTYSHVVKALQLMGCMQGLRRGGGSTPSQWRLIQRPTLVLFNNMDSSDSIRRANSMKKSNIVHTTRMTEDMTLLMRKVSDLENNISNLTMSLVALTREVQTLKSTKNLEDARTTLADEREKLKQSTSSNKFSSILNEDEDVPLNDLVLRDLMEEEQDEAEAEDILGSLEDDGDD